MSTATGVPFDRLCKAARVPVPVAEYQFALVSGRQWRFDWAWPAQRVALEVEGGVYAQGRHTRGAGFVADIEKYNAAATLGWLVVRCLPSTLAAPGTLEVVRQALTRQAIDRLTFDRDASR